MKQPADGGCIPYMKVPRRQIMGVELKFDQLFPAAGSELSLVDCRWILAQATSACCKKGQPDCSAGFGKVGLRSVWTHWFGSIWRMIGHDKVWSSSIFLNCITCGCISLVVFLVLCQEFVQTLYSFEVPVMDAESVLVQLFNLFTCNKVREHVANHQGWLYFGGVQMREFGVWFIRSAAALRQKGTRHCELRRPCQWPCGHAAWLQFGPKVKQAAVKNGVWTWHWHRRRNNLHAWFSDVFRLDDVEDKDSALMPCICKTTYLSVIWHLNTKHYML